MQQILLNLIVNAAHAVADGQREGEAARGRIAIKTALVGDQIEIRVADSGVGIPPHIRARIFEPFFTTKAAGKDTGQGLAIVRGVVVDRHGGTVGLESEVGRGTTFIVRMPIASHDAVKPAA
jgi:two-component system, NtrC family, sensor kinase